MRDVHTGGRLFGVTSTALVVGVVGPIWRGVPRACSACCPDVVCYGIAACDEQTLRMEQGELTIYIGLSRRDLKRSVDVRPGDTGEISHWTYWHRRLSSAACTPYMVTDQTCSSAAEGCHVSYPCSEMERDRRGRGDRTDAQLRSVGPSAYQEHQQAGIACRGIASLLIQRTQVKASSG